MDKLYTIKIAERGYGRKIFEREKRLRKMRRFLHDLINRITNDFICICLVGGICRV